MMGRTKGKHIQKNAFSILVVFIALAMAGLAILPMLKLSLNPSQALPRINVSCQWVNTTPKAVEEQITTPLEGVLNTVTHVEKMTSRTNAQSATIQLTIDKNANLEKVRFEVATAIRRVYKKLPQGTSYPSISLNNPDEQKVREPVMVYTLQGRGESYRLKEYAVTELKERFHSLEGLHDIQVTGGTEQAVFINYHEERLESLDVAIPDIEQAVRRYLNRQSLGFAFVGNQPNKMLSLTLNNTENTVRWKDIIVTKQQNRLVRLTDLAHVTTEERKPQAYYRVNGLNAVNVLFYPSATANHLKLASRLKERVEKARRLLPGSYSLLLTRDSTEFIRAELVKIGWRSLATLLILLLFVLIISLNFRYMLVIFLSLAVNIFVSFSLYYLFGINIHLYSLAGITISLGLIIDNSIVMIDHLRHFANKRVYLALLASTLTTIASLSIAWFLPEKLKLTLLDFAYIIIINLFVSLAVSLWFIPALLQKIPLQSRRVKRLSRRKRRVIRFSRMYERFSLFLVKRRAWVMTAALLIFGIPVFWLPPNVEADTLWAKLYNQTIGSDWYQDNAAPYAEKILGGGLRLFVKYVYEGSVYRENKETKLYIRAGLPKGGTLEQLNRVIREMEGFLSSFDKIKLFTTHITSPQSALITIYFDKESEYSFPFIIKGRVTRRALNFGGMEWSIYGVGRGFHNSIGVSQQLNYRAILTGYNYDELARHAENLKKILKRNPRTAEVNTNVKYSWRSGEYDYIYRLSPFNYQAKVAGHSLPDIYRYIKTYDQRPQPFTRAVVDGNDREIVIENARQERKNLYRMNHTMMPDSGRIMALANIRKVKTSPDIYKENQQYIRVVGFQYNGVYKFGNRLLENSLEEMNTQMPLGYHAKKRSYDYWQQSKQKPYHLLLIIFGMVFIISAVLFESLRQPFSIMALIPLSFAGVFFTFYLFDLNFDQGGYASFILLSGLVVNSAIYIINDFNNKSGKDVKTFVKAYNSKIIPIVLTNLSTVMGLLPFLMLGGEQPFWYAFAAGSIGGLIFSLPVLIIFLPAFLLKKRN